MVINLVDTLNSILQSIFFVYVIDYCIEDNYKKSNVEKVGAVIIIFLIMYIFNYLFGNLSICIFIVHVLEMIIINCILYRKKIYESLIIYTIIYFFIALNVNIFGNLFFGFLKKFILLRNMEILMVCVIYIPNFIMGFFILKYKEKIKNIHNQIVSIKPTITTLILMNFSMDFILAFYLIFYKNESEVLRNLLSISLMLFLGIIITYFINIDIKSHKILELNKNLYEKNIELKTVQASYSKEITYMQDLYCMKKIDKIGEKLKDIINKSNVEADIKLNENNTLINNIVRKIKYGGINVIVEDEGSLSNAKITEIELHRIISNIVNNAVKAMKETGILIIKTYDIKDYVVIIIENNGPKIEEDNISKIFEAGFTTKNNSEKNHGYGLSIVKELIEKYGGNLNLISNDISTKFEIRLPLND
ncbi:MULTISPECIES: ATP-binding protein [Clostridium]|uniref:ATP-binding protein n=1 Tax=Clostridium TaxID=1485 RepID=UPI000378B670|nr:MULTISPECIES: ATP-binding protein [Clostridium]MBN1034558.1 GHKL domain-containing protein [Clostridium botulinum]MBN1063949.1 GHKL domain-containing protein [Clostridium botulinum]MBY7023941.1 GHKL domain-containing protein [Clostridium botulinum]NFH79776.1 GHKL domain-containing protein [Clostridium botulinum]NFH82379.1 GHKL domain-containing protein [Clostridium botulinum]